VEIRSLLELNIYRRNKLNTPTALFIGLTLIAAAIFFREPSVKAAHAASDGVDGFQCTSDGCYILDDDKIYLQRTSGPSGYWFWRREKNIDQ